MPLVTVALADALRVRFPGLAAYRQADGRVKLAAGWLIDQAGWKGRRMGPVGMHAHQALVLVNYGGATADDVGRLADAVREDGWQRFGVRLERSEEQKSELQSLMSIPYAVFCLRKKK